MIRRRLAGAVAGVVGIALMGSACGGGSAGGSGDSLSSMDPIELSLNHGNPPSGQFKASVETFVNYVEKATDGKVTFKTFYSGSLLPAKEVVTGVGSGVADISYVTPHVFPDIFPISAWLSAGMSQDPVPFPLGELANHAAVNDLIAHNDDLLAEYESHGLKPLWMGSAGPADMLCKPKVETLSDAKGLLARSPHAQASEEVSALGFSPVSVEYAEIYEAIQRGAIQCAYTNNGNATFKTVGHTEVAKHYVPINGASPFAGGGFVMNLDVWNSLPKDLQQIIDDASAESMSAYTHALFDQIAEFGATADADGVSFAEADELRDTLAKHQKKVYDDVAKSAPAGLADPDGLLDSLKEYRTTWQDSLGKSVTSAGGGEVSGGDELKQAFASGSDSIDWDAFAAELRKK